jgi:DNA-binding NarL/FixJ family response regulator
VVEDFKPYRDLVSRLLSAKRDLQVVCEVADGLQAVQKAQELSPDLILLDIGLPGLSGIEAARRILKFSPQSKILFLTQETSPDVMREAINLGGSGYVIKSRAKSDLLTAVDAALRGERFISNGLNHFDFSIEEGRTI